MPELSALLHVGELAVVEPAASLVQLGIRIVCLPQRIWHTTPGEHLLRYNRVVPVDDRRYPSARVEAPLACVRIAHHPDRTCFSRRLVQTLHGEADVFELCREVVTDVFALVLYSDDARQHHGLALVLPLAADQLSSELGHLLSDDFLSLLEIVCVLQLKCSDCVSMPCIVRHRSGNNDDPRDRHSAVELLAYVVAIDQPVHGLSDPRHGKRVEPAVRELGSCRVEGQFSIATIRNAVSQLRRRLDLRQQLRVRHGLSIHVQLTGQQHADRGRLALLFDNDNVIDPCTRTLCSTTRDASANQHDHDGQADDTQPAPL